MTDQKISYKEIAYSNMMSIEAIVSLLTRKDNKMKRYSIGLIIFLFLVPSFAQHTIILKEPGLDKSGFPLEKTSGKAEICLLYTSPSPRDRTRSRMPSSA